MNPNPGLVFSKQNSVSILELVPKNLDLILIGFLLTKTEISNSNPPNDVFVQHYFKLNNNYPLTRFRTSHLDAWHMQNYMGHVYPSMICTYDDIPNVTHTLSEA
jgi:hypothetical protein